MPAPMPVVWHAYTPLAAPRGGSKADLREEFLSHLRASPNGTCAAVAGEIDRAPGSINLKFFTSVPASGVSALGIDGIGVNTGDTDDDGDGQRSSGKKGNCGRSTSPQAHARPHTLVVIQGRNDRVLVRLGSTPLRFPRGFPVVWDRDSGRCVMFGFLPKFENDPREKDSAKAARKIARNGGSTLIRATKKYSGSLGITFAFRGEDLFGSGEPGSGAVHAAFASKNSVSNVYTAYAASAWIRMLGVGGCDAAAVRMAGPAGGGGRGDGDDGDNNNNNSNNGNGSCVDAGPMCVCSEVLIPEDPHGAIVPELAFVVTAVGVATVSHRGASSAGRGPVVRFLGREDARALCLATRLPIGDEFVVRGPAEVSAFLEELSDLRDDIGNATFDALAERHGAQIVRGNVRHGDLVGDVLEGLIIRDDRDSIVKFKFPRYTTRTFGLREALGKFGPCGMTRPVLAHFRTYAGRWTVTEAGARRCIADLIGAWTLICGDGPLGIDAVIGTGTGIGGVGCDGPKGDDGGGGDGGGGGGGGGDRRRRYREHFDDPVGDRAYAYCRRGGHLRAMDAVLADRDTLAPLATADDGGASLSPYAGHVVLVTGPIGYGKSTFATQLCDAINTASAECAGGATGASGRQVTAVHIDADDVLGLGTSGTMRLGGERNDATRAEIIRALAEGRIVVVSLGGGQVVSAASRGPGGGDRQLELAKWFTQAFLGRDLCVTACIPIADPSNGDGDGGGGGDGGVDDGTTTNKVELIDGFNGYDWDHDTFEAIYASCSGRVARALRGRLDRGAWSLPPGKGIDAFTTEIRTKSLTNSSASRAIALAAEQVFSYPPAARLDLGDDTCEYVSFAEPRGLSDAAEAIIAMHVDGRVVDPPGEVVTVQDRLLARVDGNPRFPRYGHVTMRHERKCVRTEEMLALTSPEPAPYVGATLGGTLVHGVTVDPETGAVQRGRSKKEILVIVVRGVPERPTAHVTVNPGGLPAVLMNDVTAAFNEGKALCVLNNAGNEHTFALDVLEEGVEVHIDARFWF